MSQKSIRDKTIRPGSLSGYSYYYSNRRTEPPQTEKKKTEPKQRGNKRYIWIAVLIVGLGFWFGFRGAGGKTPKTNSAKAGAPVAAPVDVVNYCDGNSLDKFIKISITKRRLWACTGSKEVYSVAVITGLRNHPETETPVGTYKVYAKQTDTTLRGADSRGTWNDPVSYWIPFLDNQYGTYGFHDATWRPNTDFGKISPDSADASHGCIELPLASSKWLYDWTPVGTTVTVVS
jgi:lipoprotein-anchoring transpeptidase ErfK/SrfK